MRVYALAKRQSGLDGGLENVMMDITKSGMTGGTWHVDEDAA